MCVEMENVFLASKSVCNQLINEHMINWSVASDSFLFFFFLLTEKVKGSDSILSKNRVLEKNLSLEDDSTIFMTKSLELIVRIAK